MVSLHVLHERPILRPLLLGKCHKVGSMTLCAELTFSAVLVRSESRGFHFREDFPERDDKLAQMDINQKGGREDEAFNKAHTY